MKTIVTVFFVYLVVIPIVSTQAEGGNGDIKSRALTFMEDPFQSASPWSVYDGTAVDQVVERLGAPDSKSSRLRSTSRLERDEIIEYEYANATFQFIGIEGYPGHRLFEFEIRDDAAWQLKFGMDFGLERGEVRGALALAAHQHENSETGIHVWEQANEIVLRADCRWTWWIESTEYSAEIFCEMRLIFDEQNQLSQIRGEYSSGH